jgi:haloalkane dehalogenase
MRMVPESTDHPSTAKLRLIEAYVETLDVPAEIVWGMKDPIFATALPVMRSYFPQARVTETEAGHFLQENKGEELAQVIVDFIASTL